MVEGRVGRVIGTVRKVTGRVGRVIGTVRRVTGGVGMVIGTVRIVAGRVGRVTVALRRGSSALCHGVGGTPWRVVGKKATKGLGTVGWGCVSGANLDG